MYLVPKVGTWWEIQALQCGDIFGNVHVAFLISTAFPEKGLRWENVVCVPKILRNFQAYSYQMY